MIVVVTVPVESTFPVPLAASYVVTVNVSEPIGAWTVAVQTCVPLDDVHDDDPTLIVADADAPPPTTATVIDCVDAPIYAGERFEEDALAEAAGMRIVNCAGAVFVDDVDGAGELVATPPIGVVGSADRAPPPPPQPLSAMTSNSTVAVRAR